MQSSRGGGQKKRRPLAPAREYQDYGVHSNNRTVRLFDLPADGGGGAKDGGAKRAVAAAEGGAVPRSAKKQRKPPARFDLADLEHYSPGQLPQILVGTLFWEGT